MAACDYKSCAHCEGKTFYDEPLDGGWSRDHDEWRYNGCGPVLALCLNCERTHQLIVVERPPEGEGGG